jgi:hypothetical protein
MKGEGSMSVYSNHFPEVINACRFAEDPRESGPVCECSPEGNSVGEMCEACQADYDLWLAQVDAQLPLPGEEFEPCGQMFVDGPLSADLPF